MSLRDWLRNAFGGSARGAQARCLVCDSTDLVSLAADAYRCSSCGHEGGDGLPAWIAARKRAEIQAMSPEQRLALARKQLEAVRNLLAGINLGPAPGVHAGDIAAAVVKASVHLAVGVRLGDERQEDQEREVGTAFRDLLESEQLLDQAATALGDQLLIPPMQRLAHTPLRLEQPDARAKLIRYSQIQWGELDRLVRLTHR